MPTSLLVVSGSEFKAEEIATTAEPFTRGPVAEMSRSNGMERTTGSPPTDEEAKELSVQTAVVVELSTQPAGNSASTMVVPIGAEKKTVSPNAELGP
jgi:hypothetical protein